MRNAGTIAVLACVVLTAAACSDDDSSSAPRRTSTSTSAGPSDACEGCPVFGESDTTIEVASGDDFVIELESNQTTGYQWTATSSDEAVVREESNEYVAPSSDALGAPGTERFVFAPGSAGSATLTLLYSRSFEDGADARQIVYTVTVA
jgi:inhibitor of cysteine peptidase